MILYRDLRHVSRCFPPSWIAGAPELQCREDAAGRLWGIGDPTLIGPGTGWIDLDDGWQVRQVGKLDASQLIRHQLWCDVRPTASLEDVIWIAPAVLTIEGTRAFRIAYGDNFEPALTETQQRLMTIATEARTLVIAAQASGVIDSTIACRYTAELLSAVNYVTPEVLAKLRLLDDALAVDGLVIAAGYRQEVPSGSYA